MLLPQYAGAFLENEVDGELLLWLQDSNLEQDLGVRSEIHRRRLLEEIANMRPQSANVPSSDRDNLTAGPQEVYYDHDVSGDAEEHKSLEDIETAAAVTVQTSWRRHSSRSKFGQHIDIIRRFEKLKPPASSDGSACGAASSGLPKPDSSVDQGQGQVQDQDEEQQEDQDVASEVKIGLEEISNQLREQLAQSKAQRPQSRWAKKVADSVATGMNVGAEDARDVNEAEERAMQGSGAIDSGVAALHQLGSILECGGSLLRVTIPDQRGKLGVNFGERGTSWPIVHSVAPDSVALAGLPELRPGVHLWSIEGGVDGEVDVSNLTFKQGTAAFKKAGRPVTLTFWFPFES